MFISKCSRGVLGSDTLLPAIVFERPLTNVDLPIAVNGVVGVLRKDTCEFSSSSSALKTRFNLSAKDSLALGDHFGFVVIMSSSVRAVPSLFPFTSNSVS